MASTLTKLTEERIPAILRDLGLPWPRVEIREIVLQPAMDRSGPRPDLRVDLGWQGRSWSFAAEAKTRSVPKAIETAIRQAEAWETAGQRAMIIAPYLNERWLIRLAEREISGLDLSGNGIVIVPGELLLWRSGQPNRFPESRPTKFAYRGATSLVPRVFLSRPRYEQVRDIQEEIEKRGASVALSTVSKALKRMEDDVLIRRSDGGIALLQADELLEKLQGGFEAPAVATRMRVRAKRGLPKLFQTVNDSDGRPELVMSGESSFRYYVAGRRSDEPIAYCRDLRAVRDAAGDALEETERFADLTIIETGDRTPFFDARQDENGIAYASALQAYLELNRGDKRDREMAAEIRARILSEIGGEA